MPHLAIIFWCWEKQGAEKQVSSLGKNKIFGSDLLKLIFQTIEKTILDNVFLIQK